MDATPHSAKSHIVKPHLNQSMIDAFKVSSVMTRNVFTVTQDTPIHAAITQLAEHDITGLPVVDEQLNLLGIITEKDTLKLLFSGHLDHMQPVSEFMTQAVVTFTPDDSLMTVCDCFLKNTFRRVPVLSGKKVVGILSRSDIILFLNAALCSTSYQY